MPLSPPPVKAVGAAGWRPGAPHTPPDLGPGCSYRLTFGKHRGKRLDEVPVEYVLWLVDGAESPALRLLCKKHLELDCVIDEAEDEPRADLAAVALLGVAFNWWSDMRVRYAGDAAALAVIEAGFDALMRLASAYTKKPWPPAPQRGGAA